MPIGFQGAFTGGELDPALSARVDLAKYGTGCKLLKNFIAQPHGGAYRRPGLGYVTTGLGFIRLIPFQYNVEQAYVLAFSALKMRVIKDGGVVLESSKDVSAATKADPVQVTTATHEYVTGDDVYISGVVGMKEINGRVFRVTVVDTTNFTLDDIDGTGYTAYTSGGTAERLYTVVSPYAEADLNELYFTQSADVLYICHKDYAPYTLSRTDHDAWTFTAISFVTSTTAPSGSSAVWAGAINIGTTKDISDATKANPVKITTDSSHAFNTGDTVYITGVGGMVEINGIAFTITVVDDDEFTLDGIDGTGYTTYTSSGTAQEQGGFLIEYKVTTIGADGEESLPSSVFNVTGKHSDDWIAGNFASLTIGAVGGASEYNVYKSRNGIFGYVGSTPDTSFRDDNYVPDVSDTPPGANNPFSGNNPSTVSFFGQRLWFGGSSAYPQTLWASQVANFHNFNKSQPLRDADSLEFTLYSTQVNDIRWILPFGDLLLGTSGAEWKVFALDGGEITPSTTESKIQSYWGSAQTKPIIIGDSVVHVQHQGGKVRDLFFSLEKDSYAGNDLSIMVAHLFRGKTVVSWAYQRSPDSILWCVMSDGSLLGLTYHKEHQIWGWHKHETDGIFESVVVIPGSTYDDVYFSIKRTVGSTDYRYIERMADKWDGADIEQAILLDSYLSYSGTAVDEVSNLDHLEGETVSVLADGSIVEGLTVTDGAVTLPHEASEIHVGLPYTSSLAPMGVELAGESGTSVGRTKTMAKVVVRFSFTVGGQIGPSLDYMDSLKFTPETYGQPITPEEIQDYEFLPPGNYSSDGSFYIVQDQPLPMTVLALMPEFTIGDV